VLLVLAALPFIDAVGTNQNLVWYTSNLATVWFVMILMLQARLSVRLKLRHVSCVLMVALAGFGQVQILHQHLLSPYRLPTSLFGQTERVQGVPALANVMVDAESKRFFEGLRRMLEEGSGFREGDPIIALYDMPGVVYAMGGVSPGGAWFFFEERAQSMNCLKLEAAAGAGLKRAVLLVRERPRPEFLRCLEDAGVDFPAAYSRVGAIPQPYVEGRGVGSEVGPFVAVFKADEAGGSGGGAGEQG
jgi:hypothetical protein